MSHTAIECSKCLLSTNDWSELTFEEKGVCAICHIYDDLYKRTVKRGQEADNALKDLLHKVKTNKKQGEYDCLIGVSGGVDSTYLAYLSKEWGLNPLILHIDNGWNSELAVMNIENVLNKVGLDLMTYVVNWPEIKDLQQAYIKANVVDLDIPTDMALMAMMYKTAAKYNIKYIITGHNTVTEGWLPPNFVHHKLDTMNIRNIHKLFGKIPLKNFPMVGVIRHWYYTKIKGLQFVAPLNWIDYNKNEVKQFLMDKLSWRDYGGKHYENIFTRFYQGYILIEKFGIDKRKSHYSTLICSGQLTKQEAQAEMQKPAYNNEVFKTDYDFFIKKLDLTKEVFEAYIKQPEVPHKHYKSYMNIYDKLRKIKKLLIK